MSLVRISKSCEKSRQRRDKIHILHDIIKAAEKSPVQTHIMYNANLSHTQIKQYLKDLTTLGFLTQISQHIFETTEKGIQWAKDYNRLCAQLTKTIRIENFDGEEIIWATTN